MMRRCFFRLCLIPVFSLLFGLSGCDRHDPVPPAEPPELKPKADTETTEAEPPKEEAKPYGSEWPDLRVVETGETVTLTGVMMSKYDTDDIAAVLTEALPGHTVVNELKFGKHIKGVEWAPRVGAYLKDLVNVVDELDWHYAQDQSITIKGTVKTEREFTDIQKMTVYTLEGTDSGEFKNLLRVE